MASHAKLKCETTVYLRNHDTWSLWLITLPFYHLTAKYGRNVLANNATQGLCNKNFFFFQIALYNWIATIFSLTEQRTPYGIYFCFLPVTVTTYFCSFSLHKTTKFALFYWVTTSLLSSAKKSLNVTHGLVLAGCKWDVPFFSKTCQDFFFTFNDSILCFKPV